MDHLGESAVLDLLRGTTAVADRGAAEAHIDACAACRELVSVLARSGVMTDATGRLGAGGDELPAVDWQPGMIIAERFLLEEPAGRGAMGTVFRALDRGGGGETVVALKALTALTFESAAATTWFTREARILSELSHPAVVRYVAHGTTAAPQAYLAMQWLEGCDLGARLSRGPLPWREVVKLARRVASGLAAAHERGVVHRDVKPSNVFLVDGDAARAVVIDFGVARAGDPHVAGSAVTRRGMLVGTPSYMAPEQARARAPIDARADIFSLGCVLYECLGGTRAFAGGDLLEVLARILMETPARITGCPEPLPPRLEALVMSMLEKDPAARPASCTALDLELAQIESATGSWVRAALPVLSTFPRARSSARLARYLPRRVSSALLASVAVIAGAALALHRFAPARPALHQAPAVALVTQAPAAPAAATAALDVGGGTDGTMVPGEPPIGVLLLGIENRTTDPIFDRVTGGVLVAALDRSWKLSTYEGTSLRTLAAELEEVPGPLDEHLAPELAARDGCQVAAIRGAVIERGRGFELQVTLTDALSGEVLGTFHRDARERRNVVDALGLLATDVRHRLGDTVDLEPPETTGMSASLEADNELKIGIDTYDTGQQEEWMTHVRRAVALDPTFGRAHWVMGTLLGNLDREDEALAELRLAYPDARSVSKLSERGRLMYAGELAGAEGDFPAAVAAFSAYLEKDPRDTPVQSRLACVYEELSDYPHALAWARREARERPKEVVGRANLVILLLLDGELEESADEARRVMDEFPHPPALIYLALGESLAARGQTERAFQALAEAERVDAPSGLRAQADLQMAGAPGRPGDAVATLERALSHAPEAADPEESAATWALLVEAHLRNHDVPRARAALKQGRPSEKSATLFGLVTRFLDAGDERTARDLAAHLRGGHLPRDRHYVLLAKARMARHRGHLDEATALAQQAIAVNDTWIARRELAATYLAGGDLARARTELQACVKRVGEGAFALSDDPTQRYLAEARATLADLDKAVATK